MRNKFLIPLMILGAVALMAGGCSKESKKQRLLERADAQFKAGDFDRAEIEYLNLLRLDRTNRTALRNLAVMAYDRGLVIKAFRDLTNAMRFFPDDTDLRLRVGGSYLVLGAPKEARTNALIILSREPAHEEALLLFNDSTITTNDLKETLVVLEKARAAAPNAPGYYLALGSLQMRTNDLKGAEASFRQAFVLAPQSSAVHLALGSIAAVRNDREQAAAEFKQAAALAPLRSQRRMRYADFKTATGDAPAARAYLEELIKQTPDFVPAQLRLAEIALAERRFDDCEKALKIVLARDSTSLEGMLVGAQLRLAMGEPAKAVAELERAAKDYSKSSQVFTRLALAQLANSDLAGATRSLNTALIIQTNDAAAILLKAELDIRRGDAAAAVRALMALLERRPGLVEAQLRLAEAYIAQKDLDAALRIYEQLERAYPTNAQPALYAGLVLRQQNKPGEARTHLEAALKSTPDSMKVMEQLVELDLAERQFEAARKRVQLEIERNPKGPEPLFLLAKIEVVQTNLSAAETTLLKALDLSPGYGPADQLLARVYVAANKQGPALKKLNELVAKNTNDVQSLVQIATIQSAATNYPAAKEAYEKILLVRPGSAPGLSAAQNATRNNLAVLYAEHLGDLNRAYELARQARDLNPQDPSIADTLGWVLYRRGDHSHALTLLRESAEKLPNEGEVLYHVGMAHYMMGEEASARVALQNALPLGRGAPWVEEAQAALDNLAIDSTQLDPAALSSVERKLAARKSDPVLLTRLADHYERGGDLPKALATYEKALGANSNSVVILVKLAQLYSISAKDPKKAIQFAHQAHSLAADDPQVAYTLGRLAYEAGDHKWAVGLLRESVRKRPEDMEMQYDFARAAYSIGDVSQAVEAMRVVAGTQPSAARSAAAKEFIETVQWGGDATQAAAAAGRIQEVLARQPEFVPALMASALLQESKGNFAEARATYDKVLRLSPSFSPAVCALAVLHFDRLGDPQKAYDLATRAREASPKNAQIARVLGVLEYQKNDFARADQLLSEAAPQLPNDADVLYCLGMSQFNLKQNQASKESLTRFLALAPNGTNAAEAKKILAKLKDR